MDSLTQIVLGAAVGEVVLGKKVGNKAMLWGAVAGTIPDLDVLSQYFVDTVTAIEWHRGFSHSIFFSVLCAPIFGWLIWKLDRKKEATFKDWSWLMFAGLLTHPILDAFTTWGTQLFWPFDIRLAFQNIFVIDPMYTIPFLVCLILAMRQKRTSLKRRKYNRMGLIVSSSYLILTLFLKGLAYKQFTASLDGQGIVYVQIDTRPTPFNSILWTANIDAGDAYLIGNYSFFDSGEIEFISYPKNHGRLAGLETNGNVNRLIDIAEGWFTITKKEDGLFFNDLRFGLISLDPNEEQFAFTYKLIPDINGTRVEEVPKYNTDAAKLFSALWNRIWGN
ncbi:metal-dependent hydrolase [Maribacter halichondriae]|uniref:metal-dependent hydrolase n=1 Tax=Maribacter halichondriae TaxID=2980554 RepID=UPI00235991CF|nr:metal-dependent hydrolase [Maribacter sp. Hal144]